VIAASNKEFTMLRDKLIERRRRPTSDLLDEVIRAREDAVLVIDRDFTQMLHGEGLSLPFRL
jgi:hypothetical protein